MQDITPALKSRLLILIEQVKRDRLACLAADDAETSQRYQHLFDSLLATLHNLEKPAEAADPGGNV